MASAPFIALAPVQQAFTGGELSPLLTARPDQARYQTGARRMRNMVCIPQGAAMRRSGFRFLGHTAEQEQSVRIVPFIYSLTQTRILEFSPKSMRVWRGDALLNASETSFTPYTLATPYAAEDLADLRLTQIADVMYIAHRNYRPRKLSRFADIDWRLEEIKFMPVIQPPASLAVEYRQTATPPNGKKDHVYVVTSVAELDGEESVSSQQALVNAPPLTDQNPVRVTWGAVTGAEEYRIYKKHSGVFGFIGRVQAAEAREFDDYNILPDVVDSPPNAKDPFDGEGNYPAIVFSWQQRLGFAATRTKPLTVWLSPIGVFESMAASIPPGDADAIEFTISGSQQHNIQWVSGEKTLLIGTEGSIISINSTSDDKAITPKNIQLSVEQFYGSSYVDALPAGGTTLMVHSSGRIVREISYDFSSDGYKSPDLCLLSEHIFVGRRIVRMAWQQTPWAILWALLDDGSIASCTYMRDHDIIGWHVQTTDGIIEDICAIPGFEESSIYVLVRRQNSRGTFRSLEKLAPFFRNPDPQQAFFVDSGLSYRGEPVQILSGLDHLEGRQVQIMADGYESPSQTVTGGSISLPQAAQVVHAGLAYISEIEPVRPEIPLQTGSTMTRVRQVNGAVLRLYQSMNVLAGPDEKHLHDVIVHDAANPLNPAFVTGDRQVTIDSGWVSAGGAWKDDTHVLIRAAGPTPMTLLSIVYQMNVAASTGVQ